MSKAESSQQHTADRGERASGHSLTSESLDRPLRSEADLPRGSQAYLVLQRHARLAQLNHFELLDVPEQATSAMIRRAFQQAVLRFHPDRLRGEHERLRPLAKEIVCQIGMAFRVLEDDTTREQYRRSLAEYPHLAAVHSSIPSPRPSNPAPSVSRSPSARPSNAALRISSMPSARPSSSALRASSGPALTRDAGTVPPDGRTLPVVAFVEDLGQGYVRTPEQAFASAKIQLAPGAIDDAFDLIDQACRAEPGHPR